jgi:hypothetical protein
MADAKHQDESLRLLEKTEGCVPFVAAQSLEVKSFCFLKRFQTVRHGSILVRPHAGLSSRTSR